MDLRGPSSELAGFSGGTYSKRAFCLLLKFIIQRNHVYKVYNSKDFFLDKHLVVTHSDGGQSGGLDFTLFFLAHPTDRPLEWSLFVLPSRGRVRVRSSPRKETAWKRSYHSNSTPYVKSFFKKNSKCVTTQFFQFIGLPPRASFDAADWERTRGRASCRQTCRCSRR